MFLCLGSKIGMQIIVVDNSLVGVVDNSLLENMLKTGPCKSVII